MTACVKWPLDQPYRVVNFDKVTDGSSPFSIRFGPTGPANTQLAWVVFNLETAYGGALIAAGQMDASYQWNNAIDENNIANLVQMCRMKTANRRTLPIIGGGAIEETVGTVPIVGQPRPLYMPFPDQVLLQYSGFGAGIGISVRALILEVSDDVNVSEFL